MSIAVSEFSQGALRLRLVGPPPDLQPFVSGYYRTEVASGRVIEDCLPPEEANLRCGEGELYRAAIGDDALVDVPGDVVSGPTDRVTRLQIGGGKFWGIGLTPAGWARFFRFPANSMANRFADISATEADESIRDLLETLRKDGDDIEASVALINSTLRGLPDKSKPGEAGIRKAHLAIVADDAVSVYEVADALGMNLRTFERFCKRHLGFAPGALLRRQRFLRSLGKYMLDPSMRWINSLDTHYWDQAHFIREFRAVMNMTPSEYAALPHPIVAAAVAVTNAGSGVAMQALYHPDQPRESETGL